MSLKDIVSSLHISEISEKIYKDTIKALEIETPIGKLVAVADDNFLYILIKFKSSDKVINSIKSLQKELNFSIVIGSTKIITQLENELAEYFSGKLKSFTIPMKCFGTDFRRVFSDFIKPTLNRTLYILLSLTICITAKLESVEKDSIR